jgi:hypothetical protein
MRKKKTLGAILSTIWLLGLAATGVCAEVSQGKCVKFDESSKVITLEEYDTDFSPEHPYGRPTGATSLYDASRALIGASPKPGDVLRIAYEIKGTERLAVKVMNVTRQDLMKK